MLESEREAYERMYTQLMPALEGRWLVFHGDGLVAAELTFDAAMEVGYRRYRPGQFLVVQLLAEPDQLAEEAA